MRSVSVSFDTARARFVAEGTLRGHSIEVNAPKADGDGRRPTGFSATELLLAGAGSCAAWDVLEILRKRRHELGALDVVVDGEQAAEAPWHYERIMLHFRVQCDGLTTAVLERVIRLSCTRYCSVLATVNGVARIEATMELVDADGTSSGRLPVALALEPAQLDGEMDEIAAALGGAPEPATDED
jgi:putative redox protein